MPEIIEMPKLSDTMTVGTLVEWKKNEGDAVQSGDILCNIETDKATMGVECFSKGVLLKQYIPAGQQAAVGAPLCAIGQAGEAVPAGNAPAAAAPVSQPAPAPVAQPVVPQPAAQDNRVNSAITAPAPEAPRPVASILSTQAPAHHASPAHTGTVEGGRIKASPLAKKVAAEKGIALQMIHGTGPGGRIIRADVLAAEKGGHAVRQALPPEPTSFPACVPPAPKSESFAAPAKPAASVPAAVPAAGESIAVSGMRAAIARRLLESKTTIPHFYVETEVDADALVALRETLNGHLGELPADQGGARFTVNDFILRACAVALVREPAVNVSWLGDRIQRHGSVHLAFGVAIEDGLVTPVIRDAQNRSLRQIAAEARGMINRAKKRELRPDEMANSTFTVTNLGMFGVTGFFGIINPPNAGILSVGATIQKPVVNRSGQIVAGNRMVIGFSGDHRVVDGAVAARFLQTLRGILETPALMLV